MRIFGSDKMTVWMDRMGLPEDEPIEHRWLTRAVENAQKKVEGHNFNIRKNLLEYDDVMNYQRTGIYEIRRKALSGESVTEPCRNRSTISFKTSWMITRVRGFILNTGTSRD